MCDHGTMTVVTTPDWFWEERHHPEKGIAIDSCIADDLAAAWEAGVRTLGCCCGHGDEAPSVVLTQDPEQPELARVVLPGWTLLQWQLADVTLVGAAESGTSRTLEKPNPLGGGSWAGIGSGDGPVPR